MKDEKELTNLLEETAKELEGNGRIAPEVEWVGLKDGSASCSWEMFASFASTINYFSGYGGNIINLDLVVVGKDWWLERAEYDGKEWWEYKTIPKLKENGFLLDKSQIGDEFGGEYINLTYDQIKEEMHKRW